MLIRDAAKQLLTLPVRTAGPSDQREAVTAVIVETNFLNTAWDARQPAHLPNAPKGQKNPDLRAFAYLNRMLYIYTANDY